MDISVIVPFYKGNQYMPGLFEVIRKNAASAPALSIELLIVNDSPDHTVCYEEDWVQNFTLRILNNPHNMGIHGSRINGINAAAGRFIQMLDQDDLLADDALLSQYQAIGSSDIVVANGVDHGGANPGPLYLGKKHQNWVTKDRFYYSVANMIASPGQCLIRKTALPVLWMEKPLQKNGSDDLLLWLLMFMDNCTWSVNYRQLYTHVITGNNLSADIPKMLDSSMQVLEYLQQTGKLTKRQERRFRRSRSFAAARAGKSALKKLFSMIPYPDVVWERLVLRCYKH